MFQTHATTPTEITNVNLRTEKHGDDGDVAALDINVRAVCTSEQCEPLLGMSNEEIQAMFWDGEAGKLRSERVEPADDFILAAKTGFEERDVTVYLEYQADLVDGAEADAA